ncbi:MAG: TolB family protein [Planctomycetota bacterium]|jgi:Tol biopolymer transport system component
MNVQDTVKVDNRKVWAAVAAALSCLAIYILACVMSPVAWSPDSSKIALLVTPPEDSPDKFAIFTYDIAAGEHTLLDRIEADGILSAPAWSPDGKWIAYYKVEPSVPPESTADPNAAPANKHGGRDAGTSTGFFSEENRMLPGLLFELLEEQTADEDMETFDVKLMVASPDGGQRKSLRVLAWGGKIGDDDFRKQFMLIRPQWSPDSRRLFYVRLLESEAEGYIASLDVQEDEADAHVFGGVGSYAVSRDGKWVASVLGVGSEGTFATVAQIAGNIQKHYRLEINISIEQTSPFTHMSWTADSKRIFFHTKEANFYALNVLSGEVEVYTDSDVKQAAYPMLSATENKLYYIAGYEVGEPNSPEQRTSLKYLNIDSQRTQTVFEIPQFAELEGNGGGSFHISPDGKVVLVRGRTKDEDGNEKSTLIFWDGKTKKVVETDSWLIEAHGPTENSETSVEK